MNKHILLGILALASMLAVVSIVSFVGISEAATRPYYTKGDHVIVINIRFQNDCWDEVYARATPKGDEYRQTVLNKQTFYNNDEPDNGPSERIREKWFFQGAKVEQTDDKRLRVYATIEFPDETYGETQTLYQGYNPTVKYYYFYFNLKTNPALCQE